MKRKCRLKKNKKNIVTILKLFKLSFVTESREQCKAPGLLSEVTEKLL